MNRLLIGAAAAAASLMGASSALAADCPTGAGTIYITGSTALETVLKQMGPKLFANGTVLVYENSGSCTGVLKLQANPAGTTACSGATNCFNGGATALTFVDGTATNSVSCTVPAGGLPADLAVSDVYASTCLGDTPLDASLKDTNGPVNAFVYVVPKASSQTSLTAQQGYFVFGWPNGDGMAGPWNDDQSKWIRSETSGTQILTTRALTLTPPSAMKGKNAGGTGAVIAGVNAATVPADAEKTIGIAGADAYDAARALPGANIVALAFKWFNQKLAYWPDSSSTATDKKNVRDGHYAVWGNVHMIGAQTGGAPTGKYAAFIEALTVGLTGANAFDALDLQIAAHLVPSCAMRVQRSTDMGPLSPYTPPDLSCSCYFESKTGVMPACTTCTTTCATGVCRRGFCEAK
jgi:hypothetical protein